MHLQNLLPLTEIPPRMMLYTNQAAPGRAQTNTNDQNSKSKTNNPSTVVPNCIITGRTGFAKRYDTTAVNVLVIEY